MSAVGAGSAGITATHSDLVYTPDASGSSCLTSRKVTDSGSATCDVVAPDHVSLVVDNLGFPVNCPTTGVFLRQMQMQVVDANNNAVKANVSIQEAFSNLTTNTCGNGQPVPSSCAATGEGGVGQFLDSMSVSGNLCGSGISQLSGCGYSLTSTWSACGSNGTKTLWTSPRVVKSNSVTVNGSSTQYNAGTQFR